jgi:hypothetical protein
MSQWTIFRGRVHLSLKKKKIQNVLYYTLYFGKQLLVDGLCGAQIPKKVTGYIQS